MYCTVLVADRIPHLLQPDVWAICPTASDEVAVSSVFWMHRPTLHDMRSPRSEVAAVVCSDPAKGEFVCAPHTILIINNIAGFLDSATISATRKNDPLLLCPQFPLRETAIDPELFS